MHDHLPLDPIDIGSTHRGRESLKVEPDNLLFVDHIETNMDALRDLDMEVRALGEELFLPYPSTMTS